VRLNSPPLYPTKKTSNRRREITLNFESNVNLKERGNEEEENHLIQLGQSMNCIALHIGPPLQLIRSLSKQERKGSRLIHGRAVC
jgi:hypothetical protein